MSRDFDYVDVHVVDNILTFLCYFIISFFIILDGYI